MQEGVCMKEGCKLNWLDPNLCKDPNYVERIESASLVTAYESCGEWGNSTMCFRDLGKLNLPMVVRF